MTICCEVMEKPCKPTIRSQNGVARHGLLAVEFMPRRPLIEILESFYRCEFHSMKSCGIAQCIAQCVMCHSTEHSSVHSTSHFQLWHFHFQLVSFLACWFKKGGILQPTGARALWKAQLCVCPCYFVWAWDRTWELDVSLFFAPMFFFFLDLLALQTLAFFIIAWFAKIRPNAEHSDQMPNKHTYRT